jgi:alkanesulfonate monooxygenase SsuD/methylene tetrahydromethanopterin reductase-like flavin-dependent oxidoreductase (luciferase family)
VYESQRRTDEAIAILRGLSRGDFFAFDGAHYRKDIGRRGA